MGSRGCVRLQGRAPEESGPAGRGAAVGLEVGAGPWLWGAGAGESALGNRR